MSMETTLYIIIGLAALIILGGLGFSVILEIPRRRGSTRGLTLNARIALWSTGLLLALGTAFFAAVLNVLKALGINFGDKATKTDAEATTTG